MPFLRPPDRISSLTLILLCIVAGIVYGIIKKSCHHGDRSVVALVVQIHRDLQIIIIMVHSGIVTAGNSR